MDLLTFLAFLGVIFAVAALAYDAGWARGFSERGRDLYAEERE